METWIRALAAEALPVGRLELGEGAVDRVALPQARDGGQRAQPDDQGQRLVDTQAQWPVDRVGVAEVDPAALPLGLDQVVGHVPGRAADEQQLEVGLHLRRRDAELAGGLLDLDALAVQQPRDHGQQPGQP